MSEHTPCDGVPCQETLDHLCDLLDVYLGKRAATETCKKLLDHVKKCPTCCAEVETLSKTVEVYRHIPEEDVPDDVQNRLMMALHLHIPEVAPNNDQQQQV